MKQNHTYIIKECYTFNPDRCYKITIEDLTETSVLVKWESGEVTRYLLSEFNNKYTIVEEITKKTGDKRLLLGINESC
jgi:hypothetical protein